MNVPNIEKKAFRDMTAEERSAIVEAMLKGEHEAYAHGIWLKAADWIDPQATYRTRQRKLEIPWEHIKPEFKWAVIGFKGAQGVVLYTKEPHLIEDEDAWCYQSSMETIGAMNIDISGIDWRESLTQRPED